MLLVIGAFAVWAITNTRRHLSNLGELYLRCDALRQEIENALNAALPGWVDRPAEGVAESSSLVDLALDSLHKQAADWQQKLRDLEAERLALGPTVPLDLKLNLDFVQRELQRVRREIERLEGQTVAAGQLPAEAKVVIPPGAREVEVDSASFKRAKSVTIDMPTTRPEEAVPPLASEITIGDDEDDNAS
jgi:hypothetical protein